ncbi:hypothetical protein FACS189446_6300 [Bacteroidia bacterium]|nr:hypothetical protein FACS189446_6300 [Bacteroidia bacterium]
MKRNYLIIVLSLLLVHTSFAQDGLSDLFGKLDGQKSITQVTISKSLLNMMPSMTSSVNMNGVDVKAIVYKLEQIDIYTTEDAAMKKLMNKEVTAYFKGNKAYEILMKVKDEENNVVFYGKKDNNYFTSLIMFVSNEFDDESTLIRLMGSFTTQDIQDITKSGNKK